jgi:hypothetical protein
MTVDQELLLDRYPIVARIYDHLNMTVFDERTKPVHARELVFSCITPPLHPYLWQLGQERFLRVVSPPKPRPKRLAYCSRNDKKAATNGGRRVLNEAALLERIRAETDWQVDVFEPSRYATIHELVAFFGNEVQGILGPHGGCLTNLMFLPCNSLVVELFPLVGGLRPPLGHPGYMMYMQSAMLEHEYWMVPVNTNEADGDFQIDPALVVEILQRKRLADEPRPE